MRGKDTGFSLIEMMVSMAVVLTVSGAVFSALGYYQKSYRSSTLQADMHSGIRGALELMKQEIEQAGMLNFKSGQLLATVMPGGTAQSVPVSSTSFVFVGRKASDRSRRQPGTCCRNSRGQGE